MTLRISSTALWRLPYISSIIFSKSWSLSAFLNQIISDVPPSPGQRLRDADVTSSTVCSLCNYQPAAAFSAAAPAGSKRCYLQFLPTRTSHVLAGWRLPKQAGWAGAAQIVLKLIPPLKKAMNKGWTCGKTGRVACLRGCLHHPSLSGQHRASEHH